MPQDMARYMVNAYYQAQKHRIRATQQFASEYRDSAIVERIMSDAEHNERLYK